MYDAPSFYPKELLQQAVGDLFHSETLAKTSVYAHLMIACSHVLTCL